MHALEFMAQIESFVERVRLQATAEATSRFIVDLMRGAAYSNDRYAGTPSYRYRTTDLLRIIQAALSSCQQAGEPFMNNGLVPIISECLQFKKEFHPSEYFYTAKCCFYVIQHSKIATLSFQKEYRFMTEGEFGHAIRGPIVVS